MDYDHTFTGEVKGPLSLTGKLPGWDMQAFNVSSKPLFTITNDGKFIPGEVMEMSPEKAAQEFVALVCQQMSGVAARIAELERDLHEREQARRDGVDLVEQQQKRIAELEALVATEQERTATQEHFKDEAYNALAAERAAHLATRRALVDCANEVNDSASDEVVYAIKRLHGPVIISARADVAQADGKEAV